MKRNQERNQEGSCLLILIIITSVIFLYYINAWQQAAISADLAIKKCVYEKYFRATESLYNYGLTSCLNNFERHFSLIKTGTRIILFKGAWPPAQYVDNSSFKTGQAILRLHPGHYDRQSESIIIEATLTDPALKCRHTVKAELVKEEIENAQGKKVHKKFKVVNWQVNTD